MLELMKKRRSIRRFSDATVSQEHIESMLLAALLSPTSMGKKPVEFITVQDKETLTALAACKAHSASFLAQAPLGIVVIADTTASTVWVEDASIAAIALQLQAEYLGLGSTWIQMRLRQSKEGQCSEQGIRSILGIPEHYGVLCILAIGHKGEEKKAYTDADAPLQKVHMGRFGQ